MPPYFSYIKSDKTDYLIEFELGQGACVQDRVSKLAPVQLDPP